MRKEYVVVLTAFLISYLCLAQQDGAGSPAGAKFKMPKIGHIYGKVIDAKTKEVLPYTPVAILKRDSIIGGCMSKDNGDFSLENLPFGKFTIKISALGYETFQQVVIITPQNEEQDLGNIKIGTDAKVMKEVDVSVSKSASVMTIDRKVFNVGADITTHGGTAEDAMKNIPSVTVDASGNAQLRQQAATIYIDGRPTTLTLDQIPADQIDRIEVITNPSAKFEASATGGILNIVMKENNKPGYNGVVSGGIGTNNRYNGMVVFNYRQKPFGFSVNYNYNTSNNPVTGVYTDRTTYTNWMPTSEFYTKDNPTYGRTFQRGSATLDYFMNNRNTLSLSQDVVIGQFNTPDYQTFFTKNLLTNTDTTSGNRTAPTNSQFQNYTTKLHYRKTFPKKGEELTADVNFNTSTAGSPGQTTTDTYYGDGYTSGVPVPPYSIANPQYQTTQGASTSQIYTEQLDFVNPINDSTKLELGLRSNYKPSNQSLSVYDNYNNEALGLPVSQQIIDPALSSYYKIQDLVNAAYVNYTAKFKGWNYALGLRFEDSYYKSIITNKNDSSFTYSYPSSINNLMNSLFPSLFLTKKINSTTEFQFNISRKINRPNFRQLMPFIMASDAKDYSIGNPNLTPEFITNAELNLNKTYDKGNLFLTIFVRNSENTLTTWTSPLPSDPSILETTTINGNYSNTIGMDNTFKYSFFKGFETTFNVNLFYTKISATYRDSTSTNQGFYGIAKLLLVDHLPQNFSVQLSGSYESPKPTPQGYALPIYFADCGISKEVKKFITITGSVSDIFNTKIRGTYISNIYTENGIFDNNLVRMSGSNGDGYTQQQVTRRETMYVKLTVSIKFGRADASLFRKKKQTQNQNPDDQDSSPF